MTNWILWDSQKLYQEPSIHYNPIWRTKSTRPTRPTEDQLNQLDQLDKLDHLDKLDQLDQLHWGSSIQPTEP